MQTIKVQVPIYIPEDFKKQNDQDIFEIPISFFGPKGTSFGQQFEVKVQVSEGENELNLFKAAITMSEAGLGTFD
jgi:hypothetical protein